MEFDDFSGHSHNQYKHGHGHDHDHDHHYHHEDYNDTEYPYSHQNQLRYFLSDKLKSNPKLKPLLIAGAILTAIVLVIIVVSLLPLLTKLFHFIGGNGIKGVIDVILNGSK